MKISAENDYKINNKAFIVYTLLLYILEPYI